MDKIKAEADAIPCGKDEKIKALEALLKLAIKERDEALAYAEQINAIESALEGVVNLINNYSGYLSSCEEATRAEVALENLYKSRKRAQEAGQ